MFLHELLSYAYVIITRKGHEDRAQRIHWEFCHGPWWLPWFSLHFLIGEAGRQLSSGQAVSLGLTNFRYRTRETWFPKWSPKSKDAILVRMQSIPKWQEGGKTQLLLAIRHWLSSAGVWLWGKLWTSSHYVLWVQVFSPPNSPHVYVPGSTQHVHLTRSLQSH